MHAGIRIAATGAMLLGLVASGAWPASACVPGSGGCIGATASVPANVITLTITGSGFSFGTVQPGATATAGGVTATVTSNDVSGYELLEAIQQDASSLYGLGGGGSTLPESDIYASTGGSMVSFANGNIADPHTIQITNSTTVSAPNGDAYPLSTQIIVPGNQPGGTYTGSIVVTALGN